jgi:putative spermidine/putrescine transport system substrate-binding protein
MKRTTTTAALVAGIALVLTGCSASPGAESEQTGEFAGETMTFVGWGGAFQDAHRAAFIEPFAADTGARILDEAPTDYARLRSQVEAGTVLWDVVNVEPHIAVQGCQEGWLEPIDYEAMEERYDFELDDILDQFVGECGAPDVFYAYQIAYNTDSFSEGQHPTTWEEFFDVEAFPGARGAYQNASGGLLEAALLADGVAADELYPLDLDRAFAKLETIRDELVFYRSGDEQLQLLSSGETPLTIGWNGRIQAGQEEGLPVAGEWNEHLQRYTQLVIPKGSEHVELAHAFLAHALSPAPQAAMTDHISYAPVNIQAAADVNEAMRPYLPSEEGVQELGLPLDFEYYAENYETVTERLNEWLLGG